MPWPFLFFALVLQMWKRKKESLNKKVQLRGPCDEKRSRGGMEGDECGASCWMMRCVMEPNLLSAQPPPFVLWMRIEEGGGRGGRRRSRKTKLYTSFCRVSTSAARLARPPCTRSRQRGVSRASRHREPAAYGTALLFIYWFNLGILFAPVLDCLFSFPSPLCT